MKMKRLLACFLVLVLAFTALGFGPAAAVDTGETEPVLTAQWVQKEDLTPADVEIQLQTADEPQGDLAELQVGTGISLRATDVVTVIVELEEAPVLEDARALSDGTVEYMQTLRGQQRMSSLLASHQSVRAQLQAIGGLTSAEAVNGGKTAGYDYTVVFNGFSMQLPYGALEEARQVPGIKAIYVAEEYALPEDAANLSPSMAYSGSMVGVPEANGLGYDGTGTIIAVLDSGLYPDHEAFSVAPASGKYDQAEIAGMLDGLTCGVTDAGAVYVSEKIPFAFDYFNMDADASAYVESHGTHVAGIVAGNNGGDFQGVAPNAQLMIMKVFPDSGGTTGDDVVLAALDDAVKLGADAANLSLGAPAGFAVPDALYAAVLERMETAGVSLLVAAGNETQSAMYNPYGNNLTLAKYPDNGIVGSPASYGTSLSVASVDNLVTYSDCLMLGDELFPYNNGVDQTLQSVVPILDWFDGQTLTYVPVSGLGAEEDYTGLNVEGKLALVERGELSFTEKAIFAAQAGAVGLIVYDNVYGNMLNPALDYTFSELGNYYIPVIFISKDSGEKLLAAQEKAVSFSKDYFSDLPSATAGQISTFSSQGPGPDLSIKPEITAPGGNIYSAGLNGGYENMSGTSMAAPHLSGITALVRQYLAETQPELTAPERTALAANLLMSTAVPALDESAGTYYAVRRQGAGVVNAALAIQAEAYLSVEGCSRPKAELGSSEMGSYAYTVTVHSRTAEDKTYLVDTTVLAETVVEQDGRTFATNTERALDSAQATVSYTGLSDRQITVPAGGSATFTVFVALTQAGRDALDAQFENGTYVEGFTFLTPADDRGVTLSLPFLGFYGDWSSLDVFDADFGGDYNKAPTGLAELDAGGYGYYLGVNNGSGVYDAGKLALWQNVNLRLAAIVSLLRNVTAYELQVTDSQGQVMWAYPNIGGVRKTNGNGATGYALLDEYGTYAGWNGHLPKDGRYNSGEPAPAGQMYTYTITVTPEASGTPVSLAYPVYLDNQAPVITEPAIYTEDGVQYFTALVQDDHFIQRVIVADIELTVSAMEAAAEFDGIDQMGATTRVTFSLDQLTAALQAQGCHPGRIALLAYDMSNQQTVVYVDIGPQSIVVSNAELQVGQTAQLTASIYPEDMADTPLSWSVEDEAVAAVDENGVVTALAEGSTKVYATAPGGLTAYGRVTVIQEIEALLSYGEAPELNDRFQIDGLYYKVTGPDTVQVTGDWVDGEMAYDSARYRDLFNSENTKLVIPDTVEYSGKTFRVTSIGYRAFYSQGYLTEVTLPAELETIGEEAFQHCYNITNMVIPDSVQRIDSFAFYGVRASLNIPHSLVYVGAQAYFGCNSMPTITFPSTLKEIGAFAFSFNNAYTVEIPDTLPPELFNEGFIANAPNLRYLHIPETWTFIPDGFCSTAPELTEVQIPSRAVSIGSGAFSYTGIRRLELPAGLKTIGDRAFSGCDQLTAVTIPDSVESIGAHAFTYCESLASVSLGSGVTAIGENAFEQWDFDAQVLLPVEQMQVKTEAAARALRKSGYSFEIRLNGEPFVAYVEKDSWTVRHDDYSGVYLTYVPNGPGTVKVECFYDHLSMLPWPEHLVIPETVTNEALGRTYTVTEIGETSVFYRNRTIKSVSLPDTIVKIGEDSMNGLSYFTDFPDMDLSGNWRHLGAGAFTGLGFLAQTWERETLTLPSLTHLGKAALAQTRFTTVDLSGSTALTSVGEKAFNACYDLTQVLLPDTLQHIGVGAFAACGSMTDIMLPGHLRTIDRQAFAFTPLDSVAIPQHVTYIGTEAFRSSLDSASRFVVTTGLEWEDWLSVYQAEHGRYAYPQVGASQVTLNGGLQRLGWNSFRPDAEIVAVLNSQRNMVVQFGDMKKLPTVVWDGKTDIPFNDGSYVPAGEELHLTQNVTIDGKLTVDGKVYVPYNVHLEITDDALIVNPENIIYEGCKHENTTTITQPATCTEDGLVTVVCDDCGTVLSEEVIPANCPSQAFADLDTTRWYHEYTDYVIGNGLMNGVGDNRFAPNNNTTRGQLVTVLYRLAGSPAVEEAATFTDVAGDIWYSAAIAWAEDMGIAQGVTETRFAPGNTVTREQAATFLYRFVTGYLAVDPVDGADLSVYTDAGNISGYAEEAVAWATAEGLFEGFPDGRLLPQGTLTRAQMAKLLAILDQKF